MKQDEVTGCTWLGVGKGDVNNPDYGARLVGRGLKTNDRPEFSVATFLLDALGCIVGICASNRQGFAPYRVPSSELKGHIYMFQPPGQYSLKFQKGMLNSVTTTIYPLEF